MNILAEKSPLSETGKVFQWLQDIKRYEVNQNWGAELKTARQAINTLKQDSDFRFDMLILVINALGNYVSLYGSSPKLDAEAKDYYIEGINQVRGDNAAKAKLDHILGIYYSKSTRNGKALPYLLRELEYLKTQDNIEQLFVATTSMASLYGDMGQLGLEKHYRLLALKMAQENFIVGFRPPAGQLWLSYLDTIWSYIDDIAEPGRTKELLTWWKIAEPIHLAYSTYLSPAYTKIAYYLASTEDYDKAEFYYKRAKQMLDKEVVKFPKVAAFLRRDYICSQAEFQLQLRHYENAVMQFARCLKRTHENKIKPGMRLYTKIGTAYEHIGNLKAAISYYRQAISEVEVVRSSYDVADRAHFFRTVARQAYWGLIRCYTKRAAENRNVNDLYRALRTSELVRARQLGELIDPKSEPSIALQRFKKLHKGLGPTEVVLDYILTEQEIVILAFSKEAWSAQVVEYNPIQFSNEIHSLASDLAKPTSSLSRIQHRLTFIAKKLLDPVASLMRGKQSIIALPDGAANLVPFDLLTDLKTNKPLIESRVVWVAPSLRLIKALRKKTKVAQKDSLYAIADPVYSSNYKIAGLSRSELKSMTRGSNYLKYFSPLPETRTEVQSIAQLFPANKVKMRFGKSASESVLKKENLSSYQYIHLATHGILGSDVPGIVEPSIVLSDEIGQDGFFTASEAAKLSLNAELTVLSACKTGTGKLVKGEGVMGMSRAFLLAGSKSVLVSLWSVDSKMTELLMVKFYQHLRTGKNTASALRQAKLDLVLGYKQGGKLTRDILYTKKTGSVIPSATSKQLHPYYWAAFILVGG